MGAGTVNRLTYDAARAHGRGGEGFADEWRAQGRSDGSGQRDPSLWTGRDEGQWLGWLGITNGQLAHIQRLLASQKPPRASASRMLLLLGMGGSSLAPRCSGQRLEHAGFPQLHVLDSTDPAQVKAVEGKVDLEEHAVHRLEQVGLDARAQHLQAVLLRAGEAMVGQKRLAAASSPSPIPARRCSSVAEGDGFRHVFFGWPDIGGRYSALSDFGLVPAASWAWMWPSSWTGPRKWSRLHAVGAG